MKPSFSQEKSLKGREREDERKTRISHWKERDSKGVIEWMVNVSHLRHWPNFDTFDGLIFSNLQQKTDLERISFSSPYISLSSSLSFLLSRKMVGRKEFSQLTPSLSFFQLPLLFVSLTTSPVLISSSLAFDPSPICRKWMKGRRTKLSGRDSSLILDLLIPKCDTVFSADGPEPGMSDTFNCWRRGEVRIKNERDVIQGRWNEWKGKREGRKQSLFSPEHIFATIGIILHPNPKPWNNWPGIKRNKKLMNESHDVP